MKLKHIGIGGGSVGVDSNSDAATILIVPAAAVMLFVLLFVFPPS
jgi:hypothetical protein